MSKSAPMRPPRPSKPPLLAEFPSKIDSTILAAFDACHHKGFREFMQHLSPLATSPDLHAGGAFARGTEVVRKAVWEDNLSLDDALLLATRAFTVFWGDYEPPPKRGLPHVKSYTNMLLALHAYFDEYPPLSDPFQPYMIAGKPAIEFTFAVPMDIDHPETGEELLFCGRLDMLGIHNGLLTLLDDKTAGSLGVYWSDQWRMRGQFLGYGHACRSYGIDVTSAVVRGIAIQKTQFLFETAVSPLHEWQMDRWWKEAHLKVLDMIDAWRQYRAPKGYGNGVDAFRRSYCDACGSYGGCVYALLCTSRNPEHWEGEYQTRKWDPLAKDPTTPNAV